MPECQNAGPAGPAGWNGTNDEMLLFLLRVPGFINLINENSFIGPRLRVRHYHRYLGGMKKINILLPSVIPISEDKEIPSPPLTAVATPNDYSYNEDGKEDAVQLKQSSNHTPSLTAPPVKRGRGRSRKQGRFQDDFPRG